MLPNIKFHQQPRVADRGGEGQGGRRPKIGGKDVVEFVAKRHQAKLPSTVRDVVDAVERVKFLRSLRFCEAP